MTGLARSGRLVSWYNAWLGGHCSLDDARDGVIGADTAHDVLGIESEPVPLVLALGRLRARGADRATLALPVPGDPTGLGGPPEFNALAVEAAEAVLLPGAGLGLVPAVVGAGVTWQVMPAAGGGGHEDLAEADLELREALLESSARLVDLDVPRWRPEAAAGLRVLREVRPEPLAPGHPARAQRLAALALRCAEIVQLGLDDDGAAVSAFEAAERRDALLRLARSARHALVTACSAVDPPPGVRPEPGR